MYNDICECTKIMFMYIDKLSIRPACSVEEDKRALKASECLDMTLPKSNSQTWKRRKHLKIKISTLPMNAFSGWNFQRKLTLQQIGDLIELSPFKVTGGHVSPYSLFQFWILGNWFCPHILFSFRKLSHQRRLSGQGSCASSQSNVEKISREVYPASCVFNEFVALRRGSRNTNFG